MLMLKKDTLQKFEYCWVVISMHENFLQYLAMFVAIPNAEYFLQILH